MSWFSIMAAWKVINIPWLLSLFLSQSCNNLFFLWFIWITISSYIWEWYFVSRFSIVTTSKCANIPCNWVIFIITLKLSQSRNNHFSWWFWWITIGSIHWERNFMSWFSIMAAWKVINIPWLLCLFLSQCCYDLFFLWFIWITISSYIRVWYFMSRFSIVTASKCANIPCYRVISLS